MAALSDEMLDHLYVHPDAQEAGAGSALLDKAKERRPGGHVLGLPAERERARLHERRLPAPRAAYGRGGNEERTPDALYEWRSGRRTATLEAVRSAMIDGPRRCRLRSGDVRGFAARAADGRSGHAAAHVSRSDRRGLARHCPGSPTRATTPTPLPGRSPVTTGGLSKRRSPARRAATSTSRSTRASSSTSGSSSTGFRSGPRRRRGRRPWYRRFRPELARDLHVHDAVGEFRDGDRLLHPEVVAEERAADARPAAPSNSPQLWAAIEAANSSLRRRSSSVDSSSIRVAICQMWPNGSRTWPKRHPRTGPRRAS